MTTKTEEKDVEVMAPEQEQPAREIAKRDPLRNELSVDDVMSQIQKVQALQRQAMKEGEHFGVIPGTNKPSLLKAGAEKLCFIFRLGPRYTVTTAKFQDGHREYTVVCDLLHIPSGTWVGQGLGVCSTLEGKYRWRKAQRECPSCNAPAIKRSQYKDKDTGELPWYCHEKVGGCNAKFAHNDPAITEQEIGKVENPDIADVYNTVIKMAKKRAHVDATLTATAASDIFAQDLEDLGQGQTTKKDGNSKPVSVESIAKGESRGEEEPDRCKHRVPLSTFCDKCSQESDQETAQRDLP